MGTIKSRLIGALKVPSDIRAHGNTGVVPSHFLIVSYEIGLLCMKLMVLGSLKMKFFISRDIESFSVQGYPRHSLKCS